MLIGGLQKLTLLDYPEHIAAIVFTQGCNFRCHYCYNPKLVVPEIFSAQKNSPAYALESFFDFLDARRGKLDAVVITGGEPTLHHDLPQFIQKIKAKGFLVKLDTNGTNPAMLKKLLDKKLLDYIAMDIKAPLKSYAAVVGVAAPLEKLQKSIILIKKSGIPYEFRSTLLPSLHGRAAVAKMGQSIRGAEKWYLQKFKSNTALVNDTFKGKSAYTDKEMEELRLMGSRYVKQCFVR
ncbi:anaerobic ribonucleoside-triphosphate reductase activating protein [Candidatus Falkowbacteria bacterium RIFOXYC2_FULL_47_12]|uniref:Anaerobic ribonucleoside-triphosphate reductase activating protein n=1 Tax=Candidatus Falkowbacteria bacterium RIFOXYC2_FULL_47_12 TaxID=1798004 RepID=A0A1F5TRR5_9BACT|nr:MAG: anaerobic ribonucleoside-triphosphate reductase activating protein [Candidatus Falkowbacteria bacterium RIFOXYC2_FULL_47_12]